MAPESRVITSLSDDPRVEDFLAAGWTVVARSWGARLTVDDLTKARLESFVARVEGDGFRIRELDSSWSGRLLELDERTSGDYPGGPATTHVPLDAASSLTLWTDGLRVFGAVVKDRASQPAVERLVAATVIGRTEQRAETEFTAVARTHRRRGIATAVKAGSILALMDQGASVFGTGGSSENVGMLAVNAQLGYLVTEEWLSFAAAGDPAS